MPELGIPPERIVFITGIGCAGRFSYYMDTYGMHSIHGRAPRDRHRPRDRPRRPVDLGDHRRWRLAVDRRQPPDPRAGARQHPGQHPVVQHQIYGLTKGQASPTSELGKITKSTPFGVADHPFNPLALAIGAEGDVRRPHARPRPSHMTEVLRAAALHQGSSLVEIYQNCPVFNDGPFFALTEKETKDANQIRLVAGEPDPLRRRRCARGRDAHRRRPSRSSTSPPMAPMAS